MKVTSSLHVKKDVSAFRCLLRAWWTDNWLIPLSSSVHGTWSSAKCPLLIMNSLWIVVEDTNLWTAQLHTTEHVRSGKRLGFAMHSGCVPVVISLGRACI